MIYRTQQALSGYLCEVGRVFVVVLWYIEEKEAPMDSCYQLHAVHCWGLIRYAPVGFCPGLHAVHCWRLVRYTRVPINRLLVLGAY